MRGTRDYSCSDPTQTHLAFAHGQPSRVMVNLSILDVLRKVYPTQPQRWHISQSDSPEFLETHISVKDNQNYIPKVQTL